MNDHRPKLEPSEAGRVVLDIGDDVGAAIVLTPAWLADHEIEIRAQNSVWAGRHVAVLERRLAAGPAWAAVFPSLTEGRWEIRVRHNPTSPVVALDVAGGCITTVRLAPVRPRRLTKSGAPAHRMANASAPPRQAVPTTIQVT